MLTHRQHRRSSGLLARFSTGPASATLLSVTFHSSGCHQSLMPEHTPAAATLRSLALIDTRLHCCQRDPAPPTAVLRVHASADLTQSTTASYLAGRVPNTSRGRHSGPCAAHASAECPGVLAQRGDGRQHPVAPPPMHDACMCAQASYRTVRPRSPRSASPSTSTASSSWRSSARRCQSAPASATRSAPAAPALPGSLRSPPSP